MVSVLIPVYNGEKHIRETIDSALNQTVDVEVVAIDDCSTDDSFLIIQEIARGNNKLKLYRNDSNMGLCKTINNGVLRTTGNCMVFVGQDDILSEDHCEKMMKYFADNTSIVFCDYDLMDEYGTVFDTQNHCIHSNKTVKDFFKDNALASVGVMLNKEKLMKVGGYPSNDEFPHYGEYHTWIRMALEGDIVFCSETRPKYRRHQNNITNDFQEKRIIMKLNKYFFICRKQILTSPKVKFCDKMYVFAYMLYRTIRAYILGR